MVATPEEAMMQQMAFFEQIFSDAHLIDIGLSAWEKHIALHLLADHAGVPRGVTSRCIRAR
jgi:hypothetical protein